MTDTPEFLTLEQASRIIPGRPHVATLWRWISKGVKNGIRLECIAVGGRRLVRREAVDEFLRRCHEAVVVPSEPCPAPQRACSRSKKQLERDLKNAERVLRRR